MMGVLLGLVRWGYSGASCPRVLWRDGGGGLVRQAPRSVWAADGARFHLVLHFPVGQDSCMSKKPMPIGQTIEVLPAKSK